MIHGSIRLRLTRIATSALLMMAVGWIPKHAISKTVELRNGMELQGYTDSIPTIGVDVLAPAAIGGNVDVAMIVVVDDGLRRTFFSKNQLADVRPDVESLNRIRLKRNSAVTQGSVLGRIGDIVRVTPFDEWGRRTFSTLSAKGQLDVFQGITEVSPVWTRVQGLKSGMTRYVWDMRIATSSVPRDQLRKILRNHLDETNPDVRLSIVQLYLQAERYGEAEDELRAAIRDFPEFERLKQQLKELRQLRSQQQLGEIKLRQSSGQHLLVTDLLQRFPDEDVAGEILLEVSELMDAYKNQATAAKTLIEKITAQTAELKDPAKQKTFQALIEELDENLSSNTLPRLADYQRLLPDAELDDEQKLALAMSGWLLGGTGTENIEVANSLWDVREYVVQYLRSTDAASRKTILAKLGSLEGGSPKYVSQILATIKPPIPTPGAPDPALMVRQRKAATAAAEEQSDKAPLPTGSASITSNQTTEPTPEPVMETNPSQVANQFHLQVSGVDEKQTIDYVVQLPPEYDPHRRYPAIVTLHAAGATPEMQISWWAGSYNEALRMRMGQAARRGYVVIAPAWTKYRQKEYQYTAQEHASALFSLRDAMQRFSIDSDRVFLSGHSMGGDAAWDIGLAHPDVWAGVIPISAVAEYNRATSPKYVTRYSENAKHVAFYFVGGAFDGKQIDTNARDWNRYLRRSGYDTIIVEYLGRGHEHFQDEIQRIFTWMELHRRDFFPTEFEIKTMRPWDRFYWWVEGDGLAEKSMILPAAWPPRGNIRPTTFKASITDKQKIYVKAGAGHITLWLSPEIVDLDARLKINVVGGKARSVNPNASVEVMLEDARRRGDRQHPFWAKVDLTAGRIR